MIQLFYSAIILELGENESFRCTLDQPKTALTIATAGVCLAALASLVVSLWRRFRAALTAAAVEGALALVWVALGGLGAAGCALGV